MSGFINRLRRKIAGIVLGEQFAMYLPKDQMHIAKSGLYTDLPDDVLGAVTRYWFAVITKSNAEIAVKRKIPVTVFSTSQAVMSVIRYAIDANATNLEITQSGHIAGQDIGVWKVTAERQPDDYDFGLKGVQEEWSDDGRLTKLTLGYSFTPDKPA